MNYRWRPKNTVLSSQRYYWTEEWQAGEAEALGELERGEGRTFKTGREAAEWLLSDDDDADKEQP